MRYTAAELAKCAPIITGALAFIMLGVWIRRRTWRCRWEIAGTLNVLLQGLSLVLIMPRTSPYWDRMFHSITGWWNVEDLIGMALYMGAFFAFTYDIYSRLTTPRHIARLVTPAVAAIPVILIGFVGGNGPRVYRADMLDVPVDGWLFVYWVTACGAVSYLALLQIRGLIWLREDGEDNTVEDGYITAAFFALCTCATQIVAAMYPNMHAIGHGRLVWVFSCLSGAWFGGTSALAWGRKVYGMDPESSKLNVTIRLLFMRRTGPGRNPPLPLHKG